MGCSGKASRILGIGLLAVAGAAAAPVMVVESSCRSVRASAASPAATSSAVDDADYRRLEARSYLTYPEWYVIQAHEDFAGVLRRADASSFRYVAGINGFWSSLCGANRIASESGPSALEFKARLYATGLRFTAEMAVKGLYETTIGRLTSWLRGPERTAEDIFALRLAEDYAAFLRQAPWQEYPFATQLARFWRETPLSGDHMVRKLDRRIALSLEYGAKAVYAALLRPAANPAPAEARILCIVTGVDETDVAADPRIRIVRDLDGGQQLIEAPRHQAFTEVLRGLFARGRKVMEIAGNDDVLVTALVPAYEEDAMLGGSAIFSIGMQSRPGWRRVGLSAKVARLGDVMRAIEAQGGEFEHIYDY